MSKANHTFWAALAAGAFAGCPTPKPPPNPDPYPATDGGFDDEDAGTAVDAARSPCSYACQRARAVSCSAGFGVDGGETCTATCEHVVTQHSIELDVECMRHARDLTIARGCAGWGCR